WHLATCSASSSPWSSSQTRPDSFHGSTGMWYLPLRCAIPCPTPRSGSSPAQPQGLTSILDRALQVLDLLVCKRSLVGFGNLAAHDVFADDRPFVGAAGPGDLEEAAELAGAGVGIPSLPELLVVDREDRDRPAGD